MSEVAVILAVECHRRSSSTKSHLLSASTKPRPDSITLAMIRTSCSLSSSLASISTMQTSERSSADCVRRLAYHSVPTRLDAATNACGVDKPPRRAGDFYQFIHGINCCSGDRIDDRAFLAREPIQQTRFPDIRTPKQCQLAGDRNHGFAGSNFRKPLDDLVRRSPPPAPWSADTREWFTHAK